MLKSIRTLKEARLQWLQDPSEKNGDNLNNLRRETSRHFRNKKMEYLKEKNCKGTLVQGLTYKM
jgi:hypothetical protein